MHSVVLCRDGLLHKRLAENMALYLNRVICFNQWVTCGGWRKGEREKGKKGRGKREEGGERRGEGHSFAGHHDIDNKHHMTSHDTSPTPHDIRLHIT